MLVSQPVSHDPRLRGQIPHRRHQDAYLRQGESLAVGVSHTGGGGVLEVMLPIFAGHFFHTCFEFGFGYRSMACISSSVHQGNTFPHLFRFWPVCVAVKTSVSGFVGHRHFTTSLICRLHRFGFVHLVSMVLPSYLVTY